MKKCKFVIKSLSILMLMCFISFIKPAFAQQAPLPIDQAFQLSITNIEKQQITLHWQIAAGYHLYQDRFRFIIDNPQHAILGQVILPTGIATHDDILGNYRIYKNNIDINIPFARVDADAPILLVTYQGCSDANFCYPPITKRINVNFNDRAQTAIQSHEGSEKFSSVQGKITELLNDKNYFLICLAFVGFGLLLAFTPCVLPMIPILSGIIMGQERRKLTTKRAFLLSLAYVLGMAISYAVAGVLVALAGSHLAETFQNPWVISIFSLLFIILALSLFDLYELRLPHFIQHPVIRLSNRQQSGSYIGAFIMGALSVLIVSPCVTAPLVGVLTFIAQTGDIVLGSTALFALGIGMGIPLLIIGTSEGRFLPRSGAWMHVIKSAFGILLIAIAITLLQRILPGQLGLLLWAALFIIVAVYLGVGANHSLSSGWLKFGKGLGLFAFCYGVILLVGAALGNSDVLRPLQNQSQAVSSNDSNQRVQTTQFQRVSNLSDLQAALALAKQQGKPVLLDFYADWCVSCQEMEKNTFTDPAVVAALKNTILLQADVTANDEDARAIQDHFNIIAPPTILFFNPQGNELTQFRIVGGMKPNDFLLHLQVLNQRSS